MITSVKTPWDLMGEWPVREGVGHMPVCSLGVGLEWLWVVRWGKASADCKGQGSRSHHHHWGHPLGTEILTQAPVPIRTLSVKCLHENLHFYKSATSHVPAISQQSHKKSLCK